LLLGSSKMQKVDLALNKIVGQNTSGKVAEAAQQGYSASAKKTSGHDHVDAINQMFAEFELAYHNQYHKAYAQEGSVGLAKKYWLSCLGEISPEIILRATRKVVSTQEYLPSVATIIQACEDARALFGLPTLQQAYHEACCATLPKSKYAWSHPAVYLAGKAAGWFELANQTESQIFSLFEYHYGLLCDRVLHGEALEVNIPEALPPSGSVELSADENQAQLQALRSRLNL
jgi:hypothetical protein